MKKMKFPKGRLFVCLTGVLVIMVLLTLIPAYSTETLVATVKSEAHTQEVLRRISLLRAEISVAESSARGFVVTGRETFAGESQAALERLAGQRAFLRELTADNPAQQIQLNALATLIAEQSAAIGEIIADKRRNDAARAAAVIETRSEPLKKTIFDRLDQMKLEEDRLLEERIGNTQTSVGRLNLVHWAGTATALALLLLIFFLWRRDFRQRREIERERERFFTISRDMLCFRGMDGYFKKLNPAWERALGFTEEELMARPFLEFVHPEDRGATTAVAGEVDTGQPRQAFENRYLCKDGTFRWLSWNAVRDEEKGIIYASARDITERKAAEKERERLIAELQAALAEVKTLRGLLPICSYCKNIRDDQEIWQQLESYIARNTNAQFSHSICPDCYEREVLPQFEEMARRKR